MLLSAVASVAATRTVADGEGGYAASHHMFAVPLQSFDPIAGLGFPCPVESTWLSDGADALHDGGSARLLHAALGLDWSGALARADPGDSLLILRRRAGLTVVASPQDCAAFAALLATFGLPRPAASFSCVQICGARDRPLTFTDRLALADAGLIP